MLIKCPRCKKMFDDSLNACPSCGLERHIFSLAKKEIEEQQNNSKNEKVISLEVFPKKQVLSKKIDLDERKKIDNRVEELLRVKKTESNENKDITIQEQQIVQDYIKEKPNLLPEETNNIEISSVIENKEPILENVSSGKASTSDSDKAIPDNKKLLSLEEESIPPEEDTSLKKENNEIVLPVISEKKISENNNSNTHKNKDKLVSTNRQRKSLNVKNIIIFALISILFIGLSTFSYFYYTKSPEAFVGSYHFVKDKILFAYEKIDSLIRIGKTNVLISSEPQGADIFVDDLAFNSKTPTVIKNLKVGEHKLVLKLEGYNDYSSTFSIIKNQKEDSSIDAKLVKTKILFSLSITSTPAGASIIIGDKDTGKITPYTFSYEAGTYIIKLKLPGFLDSTYTQVLNNRAAEVDLNLVKNTTSVQKGTMGLISKPNGGEVWINGEKTGKITPCSFDLPLGNYKVVIKKYGYYDWVREKIEIVEGFDRVFFALLSKE